MSNETTRTRGSDTGKTGSVGAVERTFTTLARSRTPGASELLISGLKERAPELQLAAAQAILRHSRRDGIPQLIAMFHTFQPEVQEELIHRLDDFVFPLREMLSVGSTQVRKNAVTIIRRANRIKLAYLLIQAISDSDEEIRRMALDGLRLQAESYHRLVERARSGMIDLTRIELETKKYALLDPIMSLLNKVSDEQPDELILLAMGLDRRTNERIFAILGSRQDPRSDTVNRIVWNSSSPQVVSFLLDCLRTDPGAGMAATVLQRRRDLPFVKQLLMNDSFFTDFRIRKRLHLIENTNFLKGRGQARTPDDLGAPRKNVFSNSFLALRAIHLLLLSGTPTEEKTAFLNSVARANLPMFVCGIAENVLKAMDEGRKTDEISLALSHIEDEMGVIKTAAHPKSESAGKVKLELPELELPWAHPEAESLPDDAFEQFFNTFDRLDEATRMLAVQTLKRLDGEHMERIKAELASLEPDSRLKAVKMVVVFHREQDVAEALMKLASDPDKRVRATVVKTLAILEDESAIRTLLETITDIDRRVVANSVEALETIGREELLGLVKVFVNHPNNRIRANAVKAMWNLGDRKAGEMLDDMLLSDNEMMRLSAAWVLGEIEHDQKIQLLMKIAESDESEMVRAKALSILGEID